MATALRRWWRLDSADRLLVLRATLAIALIDLQLRLLPLRTLMGKDLEPGNEPIDEEVLCYAYRYAYAIQRSAQHHLIRADCLHRSLVLHRRLRSQGQPSRFCIGVRKEGGALKAHAWVELGDEVLNDSPDSVRTFARLTRTSMKLARRRVPIAAAADSGAIPPWSA